MGESDPTVFIVDNDSVSRAALSTLVGSMHHLSNDPLSTRQFATAEDFLRAYQGEPGCVISELQLPGLGALELFDELTAQHRPLPLIVTSGSMKVSTAVEVMQRGAFTILEKFHHRQGLFSAVRSALDEDARLRIARKERMQIRTRMSVLTEIEYRIMNMMASGAPNKSMAQRLDCSVRTIEDRRRMVFRKMRADSIAELVQDLVVAYGGPRLTDCLHEYSALQQVCPTSH